jgi:hypothetical protein
VAIRRDPAVTTMFIRGRHAAMCDLAHTPVSAPGERVVTVMPSTMERMEDLAVTGHHVLNEVRRGLVRPGVQRRLLAVLVASVLVIAGSLALLQMGTGSDRSEISEIHSSAGAS